MTRLELYNARISTLDLPALQRECVAVLREWMEARRWSPPDDYRRGASSARVLRSESRSDEYRQHCWVELSRRERDGELPEGARAIELWRGAEQEAAAAFVQQHARHKK